VRRRRLVRAPGSSANLGPGFDVLAAALQLHLELEVEETGEFALDPGGLEVSRGRDNLVVQAFETLHPADGIAFRLRSEIPLARGLGSSAAAIVAGLSAADHLFELALTQAELLARATAIEGHPDNVAAALAGGLTVCCALGDGRITWLSLPVPPALRWVVLIPEVTSSTVETRAVLPVSVPRTDAVFNVQRVALLLAGLQSGRTDALAAALDDRLHQPYRLRLFPWLTSVAEAARRAGALGCVLSGAGPSLLAAVTGEVDGVARAMESALATAGIPGSARALTVDTEGAVSRTD
jgi:homoserine kinase